MKVRAKLLPFAFKLDSKLQELSELIAHGHTITQSFDACALFTEVDKDWSVFDLNDKIGVYQTLFYTKTPKFEKVFIEKQRRKLEA